MKPEKFIVVKLGEGYEVNANKKSSKSCGKKKPIYSQLILLKWIMLKVVVNSKEKKKNL